MDALPAVTVSTFPKHGRIACRQCFSDNSDTQTLGKWQVVNDPGAWGSCSPEILILGFSKGFTQANAYRAGRFEDIPFKDMRPRLTQVLRAIDIVAASERIDERMVISESRFAFGSLVRCSLARMNERSGRLECTGQVMPKAFVEEISGVVRRCAETFLAHLPASSRLVLMLGTTDAYIKGCKRLIKAIYGKDYAELNEVGYRTGRVYWAHISHPSPLNGYHGAWLKGDASTKSGEKRQRAEEIVRLSRASRNS
jgi:hypothetical protein